MGAPDDVILSLPWRGASFLVAETILGAVTIGAFVSAIASVNEWETNKRMSAAGRSIRLFVRYSLTKASPHQLWSHYITLSQSVANGRVYPTELSVTLGRMDPKPALYHEMAMSLTFCSASP